MSTEYDTQFSEQNLQNRSFNKTFAINEVLVYGDNGDGTIGAIKQPAGFPANANITTAVVTVGAVKTITETDGTRTLTTTINKTDPDNISITEVWS